MEICDLISEIPFSDSVCKHACSIMESLLKLPCSKFFSNPKNLNNSKDQFYLPAIAEKLLLHEYKFVGQWINDIKQIKIKVAASYGEESYYFILADRVEHHFSKKLKEFYIYGGKIWGIEYKRISSKLKHQILNTPQQCLDIASAPFPSDIPGFTLQYDFEKMIGEKRDPQFIETPDENNIIPNLRQVKREPDYNSQLKPKTSDLNRIELNQNDGQNPIPRTASQEFQYKMAEPIFKTPIQLLQNLPVFPSQAQNQPLSNAMNVPNAQMNPVSPNQQNQANKQTKKTTSNSQRKKTTPKPKKAIPENTSTNSSNNYASKTTNKINNVTSIPTSTPSVPQEVSIFGALDMTGLPQTFPTNNSNSGGNILSSALPTNVFNNTSNSMNNNNNMGSSMNSNQMANRMNSNNISNSMNYGNNNRGNSMNSSMQNPIDIPSNIQNKNPNMNSNNMYMYNQMQSPNPMLSPQQMVSSQMPSQPFPRMPQAQQIPQNMQQNQQQPQPIPQNMQQNQQQNFQRRNSESRFRVNIFGSTNPLP